MKNLNSILIPAAIIVGLLFIFKSKPKYVTGNKLMLGSDPANTFTIYAIESGYYFMRQDSTQFEFKIEFSMVDNNPLWKLI